MNNNLKDFTLDKISYVLGEEIYAVEDYSKEHPEWDIKKIIDKTGIKKINKVKSNQTAVDLAVQAFNNFFKEYSIERDFIDSLIFISQSPDYTLPTSACILQDRLRLRKNILVFDINLGCSGFVNGLSIATSIINSGVVSNCALVCSETYSKYISSSNRTCSTIFSDGASVTLIEKEGKASIGPFSFGVDGSGYENLIVRGSGARKQEGDLIELYMNGPEILLFTMGHVPKLVKCFLNENNLSLNDIDFFFFHQASKTVLNALQKKLKIPSDKFIYDLGDIGNTVSSTIPISLKKAGEDGKLKQGDKILIVGFGVGYSSGVGLIKWG